MQISTLAQHEHTRENTMLVKNNDIIVPPKTIGISPLIGLLIAYHHFLFFMLRKWYKTVYCYMANVAEHLLVRSINTLIEVSRTLI